MSKTTEIRLLCDLCLVDGKETAGKTITLAINGDKSRAFELCPRHEKAALGPLLKMIESIHPRLAATRRRRKTSKAVGS